MRLGVALATDLLDVPGLAAEARTAEESGFDLVWLDSAGNVDPLPLAASLAPLTEVIAVGATVELGLVHPLVTAEGAAVADRILGGRLIMGVGAAATMEDDLDEAVELLQRAHAASPFRHVGRRWSVPANLAGNRVAEDHRVRVTPPPAQLEVPMWVWGQGAREIARGRGLAYLGGTTEDPTSLAEWWDSTCRILGDAATRLRRPALRRVEALDSTIDPEATVTRLRSDRTVWGMDVAILALPDHLGPGGRLDAIGRLGREVWPRLQLDCYPAGLEDEWRELHGPRPV